jgi:hypothetical protein
MADPDPGPAPGADATPEGQVDEKRGGRPVVADQIGHQAVENVAVEPNCIDNNYSIRNYRSSKIAASRFIQEPEQESWGSFAQFKDSEGKTVVLGANGPRYDGE